MKAYRDEKLSLNEYENLVLLCNIVVKEISKRSRIKERLMEIMGTEVLLTAEERGIEKGIAIGIVDKEKYRNKI